MQFATPAANPDFWNQVASNALGNVQFATPTAAAPAAPSQTVAAAPAAPAQTTAVAPIASSTSYTASPSFLSDPLGWAASKAQNVADNPGQYATNAMMMGVPVAGTVNALSGLLGGPTVGAAMQAGTPAGPADMSADLGADGSGARSSVASYAPVVGASPVVAAPALPPLTTLAAASPQVRAYLGLSTDPYTYGYGPATSYYADGGLVSQPTPPMQPLIESTPTMAYTDGQGTVGSVAQPPGLYPSDTVGSDAPHASPMAPSPAAAAPTIAPLQMNPTTYNTNSLPVPAPISQNPNVGYSLGSPLSQLKG